MKYKVRNRSFTGCGPGPVPFRAALLCRVFSRNLRQNTGAVKAKRQEMQFLCIERRVPVNNGNRSAVSGQQRIFRPV